MPAMSTVLDQAHNAIDRKLFAMKGFHHPGGSQAAFLTGLAHLYNLIPYQRRALDAGQCGVEVEGGRVPTSDWMLNLQILTSGGYQCAPAPPHPYIRGNVGHFTRVWRVPPASPCSRPQGAVLIDGKSACGARFPIEAPCRHPCVERRLK